MSELQIKTEWLPERCEICHQADCFDAPANFCTRCECFGYTDYSEKQVNHADTLKAVLRAMAYAIAIALVFCLLLFMLWAGISV